LQVYQQIRGSTMTSILLRSTGSYIVERLTRSTNRVVRDIDGRRCSVFLDMGCVLSLDVAKVLAVRADATTIIMDTILDTNADHRDDLVAGIARCDMIDR